MTVNALGIYEKALPRQDSWEETLLLVRKLGFNYMELSVDESDERLARLKWTKQQRKELRDAILDSATRVNTLMLSGHRRFPLGSKDPNLRAQSLTMGFQAIDLAVDLGISQIQLAGYDVYYEGKTVDSRSWFIEGLKKLTDYAASRTIMLSIETMDDPFLNSLAKIHEITAQIDSPWLKSYPDLGNLTAWQGTDVGSDLEMYAGEITSVHLKDTLAVTADFPGKFRDVPFGEGVVDFPGTLRTLNRLGYGGALTIEMWTEKAPDPIAEVCKAKAFFDQIFATVGIVQESLASDHTAVGPTP